jgi:UDP-glucose:(heptosyl)LPS alpha-1,3-glucosyltransferase
MSTASTPVNELAPAPRAAPCEVTIVAHDIGNVGGMERVLAELVNGLHGLGHRVTVIARTFDAAPREGVTFHRVRAPRRPVLLAYPWFLLAGSLAVARWRRGIVQATGAIVLNRVDVISVHYCHQVGPANPSRSTLAYRMHSRLLGSVFRIAERLCFRARSSTMFVCVSDGVAAEVREYFPELAPRVRRIHNGVETRLFAPGLRARDAARLRELLGLSDERLTALFVGSEWDRKGLAVLLQALALSDSWELLVVGHGDRGRFQTLARSLGVEQRVHWLGVLADVAPTYELADAFVLPSAYETFSLVTFEAAASGVPVVATAVSGVRELIKDGENGFLITQEPRVIAERLAALASDAALREHLGAAARRSALAFSWEEMVSQHHELCEALARKPALVRPRRRAGK